MIYNIKITTWCSGVVTLPVLGASSEGIFLLRSVVPVQPVRFLYDLCGDHVTKLLLLLPVTELLLLLFLCDSAHYHVLLLLLFLCDSAHYHVLLLLLFLSDSAGLHIHIALLRLLPLIHVMRLENLLIG